MTTDKAKPPGFSGIGWRWAAEFGWRTLVVIVALAILVVPATRWTRWEGRAGWQATDDAYLQSDLTPIAAKVSGYVREAPVDDFQRVRAGQVIAQIDDDDYRVAVAQAEANVASAQAQAQALQAQQALQAANVAAAEAVIRSAVASLAQNDRDTARQSRLLATGSSSKEASERIATAHDQLTAQLAQTRDEALAAQRQLAVLAAQEVQAKAAVAAQAANLRQAQINLGYTRIVAPADGVLGQRQVRSGQYVGVGGQITTLTQLPRVWVIANYKETQLTHMAAGEAAEVRVDTFPGHVLKGHVLAFAPGSGSQFALLPPDNATGNFTKVVQRVTVKIALDDVDGLADRLRPGMSVVARIDAWDAWR